jgi:hypothetical protein
MPCRDYDDRDYTWEYQVKLDKVTRLLCELCKKIEGTDFDECISRNRELKEWWEDHKKKDRERIKLENRLKEIENIKVKALSKLSLEEIQLLGLQPPPRDK